MSGQIGDVRRVAKSRKAKRCTWCAEMIDGGQPAVCWLWKDGADVHPVRMHPECYAAMDKEAAHWGYSFEFSAGSYSRGCGCEHGACECESKVPPDLDQLTR